MADLRASSRRLMACYRGEQADRVPICSPIPWHPMRDIDQDPPTGWRAEERFARVARMVQEHCDPSVPYSPVAKPRVFSRISYQRFLEASDEYIEDLPTERVRPNRTRYQKVLHTPKGDLFWTYDVDDGIETLWDMHRPIQSPEDVEKMLSVPYRFRPPDAGQFDAYRAHRREMGADCIGGGGVNSMVAMLCGMMPFQLLLEWVVAEPGLLKMLADAWLERVSEIVEYLQGQGVGPFWHFNGVERASPPMMGPKQWDEWVMPYDGEVMRQIKSRDSEARIHVHCHGKVGTLLERFMEMGVDSTDPVEPPTQGDIEFADAKRLVDGRMVLFGNIEFVDMELCSPDEVEQKVRHAIEDGGKAHTVIFPSSTPHERPTERFLANAERYIEAGLRYGAM